MNLKTILVNLFCLSLFLILTACAEDNYTGVPITDFGDFKVLDGAILTIKDLDGLISYELKNNNGSTLIIDNSRASKYQRWVVVYTNDILWFASSDIGNVFWAKNKYGKYGKQPLNTLSQYNGEIPKSIKGFVL